MSIRHAQRFVFFASKMAARTVWSNEATSVQIDLWPEEAIQLALSSCETSKESRDLYSTLQVS